MANGSGNAGADFVGITLDFGLGFGK